MNSVTLRNQLPVSQISTLDRRQFRKLQQFSDELAKERVAIQHSHRRLREQTSRQAGIPDGYHCAKCSGFQLAEGLRFTEGRAIFRE